MDLESEIIESFVTKTRDKKAALVFIKRVTKRYGQVEGTTTDGWVPSAPRWINWAIAKSRRSDAEPTTEPAALPTTRKGNASHPVDEIATKACLNPRPAALAELQSLAA